MKKLTCLVLCLAMVLSLTACSQSSPTETTEAPTETTEPEPTAQDLYNAAVEQLADIENLTMEVTLRRKMTVGCDTYSQNVTQTLNLQESGDSFAATLEEESYLGSYYSETNETFLDGTVYAEMVQVGSYQAPMEAEEYLDRFVPAVLLDAELYTVETQGEHGLVFTEPTAAEDWLGGESAVLVEASGTAELDEELGLSRSSYTATYLLGGIRFEDNFSVNLSRGSDEPITAPEGEFDTLDSIYGPRLLDEALGWMMQAKSFSSTLTDGSRSQAGDVTWLDRFTFNAYNADEGYLSDMNEGITLLDWSGQQGDYGSYEVSYADGLYTIVYPDGTSEQTTQTDTYVQNVNQSYLIQFMMSPKDLEGFEVEFLGDTALVKCTMTDKQAEYVGLQTSGILFEDPNVLDDAAESYETTIAQYNMGIDLLTGLPTAIELEYQGVHTIEGERLILARSVDQSVSYGHPSTYEAITGEVLELKTDAPDPTPLLYKVTGENGGTMYLFGTIHVGDSRTANLPQSLLDAFASCDALAVEFDSDAFEEELENNPELLQQYMRAMLYTDGTTTDDHIEDQELFQAAQNLLKATGQYDDTMVLYKPYIWSQTIDNYNLDWSYDITSDYGLESRLQNMAREQGKEIRDVESGIEQLQMLTGFSDALQEMLLAESVYSGRIGYINSTRELFELWCTGDEAALIAYLNEESEPDLDELTDEEKQEYEEYKKLYEEYEKAVSEDRNVGMLEVAREYLESGDVVFYAVGLAHLLAEDGLVNTLREAGYTVEIVK